MSINLELFPLSYMFMVAACPALVVNFPGLKEQQEQLTLHAPPILAGSSLIFCGRGVHRCAVRYGHGERRGHRPGAGIPDSLGPVITALLSIPVTWLVSNDVFYFGILPMLAETAQHHGIGAVEMARASLVGQPVHILSPLVASTYLVVSMLKLDYAERTSASP